MTNIAEIISFIIRILTPVFGIVIVFLCFSSLRYGRREEHALIVLDDEFRGIRYPVLFWENSIGRSRNSDIRINDPVVSRDHAVLLRRDDGWFITDTGSKMGVLVNDHKTSGRQAVYIGDKITIGTSILTVKRADNYTDISSNSRIKIKKKKENKTVPCSLILALITIFTGLLCFEAMINMNNIDAFYPAAIFVIFMWIFYAVSKSKFKRRSFELESLALFLSDIGIMLSASHDLRQSFVQLAATVVGSVVFCFIIWFIEIPDRVAKWRLIISIAAIGLLGMTVVLGKVQNGAQNWIIIGPVSIQPSEFVKIAYIFVGASTLDQLQTKKNLIGFIIVTGLCVGLLFYMSDFGTAVIFFVTFLIISFMRSGNIKTVILAVTAAALGALLILSVKPYIMDRFAIWGHVWDDPTDKGYQQVNTLIYCASGGLFGVGLSSGYLQYIFASESDLVFGLTCEELGCLMALLITAVIGGFMLYARGVTTRSRSTFYSIAACSAAGLLVFQSALNIFGATDILPLTGVTLPFISEGGSSMVSCWGLLAFIKAADERTYSGKRLKPKKEAHKKSKYQDISSYSDADQDYVEI